MKIVLKRVSEIKPYLKNPRNNDKAVPKVMESIEMFGFNQPIVVDSEMVIVVGHTRFLAAKGLGYTEVPVYILDDTVSQEHINAYRIMDNKCHDSTTWIKDEMKIELNELDDEQLDETLFTLKQIDEILFPELQLIGKETIKDSVKHEVIVNCTDELSLDKIKAEIKKIAKVKCRKIIS